MKISRYLLGIAALVLAAACSKDEIDVYSVENSTVVFKSTSSSFSLKGNVEPKVTLTIPVDLIGPKTDYDRTITVRIQDAEDNTAVESQDFKVLGAVIKAGELSGEIQLEVNDLTDDCPKLTTTLKLVPNEHFIAGVPRYSVNKVTWSEEYVRPKETVWRYWFTFFCHGYSRAFHELMISEFGPEVERFTNSKKYVEEDNTLIYKTIHWWYAASRQLYERVAAYDKAHPDAPMMHSPDYEAYGSWKVPAGDGQEPEELPTMLETLNAL